MNNILNIILFQNIPTYINKLSHNLKKLFVNKDGNDITLADNIDHFKSERSKTKHALISLSPETWITAIQEYPKIKSFNTTGLTFEMVKALNENGYLVDIIDFNKEYTPLKKYDLFIGHGGRCKSIIDNISVETKIIQYVSGLFWKGFNKESEERYSAFKERKNVREKLTFRRSLVGLVDGEEYLTKKADILFTINCPRMIDSFGEYKEKFYFTGYGAYLEELLYVPQNEKNFEKGKNNFVYVGGTSGNIQKGLDLLLETFIRLPEQNLYIYCKVEKDILRYYQKELEAKNIHYIYHWRFKPFHNKLKKIMSRINFTIHAPINTGLGTAFMGSMGLGLIPVGYIDLIAPKDSCILTDSWQIDDLVKCVKEASSKSPEWCKNASELTIKNYQENCSVVGFRNKFNELVRKVTNE